MNEISIQLYSALGELVLTISDINPQRNNLIQLNASKLDEGIYFVKIKAGDYTISKPLLVDRRY
ncbi:MAG TPA: T9SS type A sorting domain-containing protein, partial [Saprospiraceae bacterium]|nr:T9SS type A sorting domain-containing protein [Saprospiraceae bacterium]